MLVGLLTVMAGTDRMTVEEVGKVLVDEHDDLLRESLRRLVAQLIHGTGRRAIHPAPIVTCRRRPSPKPPRRRSSGCGWLAPGRR
jgi:hypothetical protein